MLIGVSRGGVSWAAVSAAGVEAYLGFEARGGGKMHDGADPGQCIAIHDVSALPFLPQNAHCPRVGRKRAHDWTASDMVTPQSSQ